MAPALISEPSLLYVSLPSPGPRRSISPPERKLRDHRKPSLLPVASPLFPPPCLCAARTLDVEPDGESPRRSLSCRQDGKEGGRDRRRVVRIAWEKLVRWSRSLRSKAKSDVLEGTKKVVVLGGGSFGTAMAAHVASRKAEMEVAMLLRDGDVSMVVASKDKKLASAAQQLLASPNLRISSSSDITGVEIAGALKNVLAIAAGIVEGMNLGNNCMAALVAQGCSEIRWLATKVAEGVSTAGAVVALAQKYNVKMPVLTAVARIIDNELTPKKAVLELMSLPQVTTETLVLCLSIMLI
ncbi:hypothetical protein B296_00009622 [Ensete ventricosum]|uniref:glycerol-3-phosphate dehydrogenase (NAD(+)) n=1 Tax=Ensete ventricosum TaxID=4639 RepID=A0A427AG87_ENSVE|nr:hypothetical protein B296_00009622 [Ensete ventricosum]